MVDSDIIHETKAFNIGIDWEGYIVVDTELDRDSVKDPEKGSEL